ncbi:hypothetical protein D3C84_657660 [compost metagenome]
MLQRYQHAPAELLAQLDEPPETDPDVELDKLPPTPAVVDSAKLALMITQRCAEAGISNLVEPLLSSTKLESEAIVQAGLTRAKAVNDLCVAARLPEFSAEYVAAGLDVAAVRARLFDKIVSSGKGFEIDNSLPLDEDQAPKVQAKQPDPNSIWAARQAAQSGTARGAKGA